MSEVLEDELEEVYQFAIGLGKASGKILLEGIERRRVTTDDGAQEAIEKLNAVDIVTQTDNGMHPAPSARMGKCGRLTLSRRGSIYSLCNPKQVP
jgi:hypothetical protein